MSEPNPDPRGLFSRRPPLPRLALGAVLVALALAAGQLDIERVLVLQPYNIDSSTEARFIYEVSAPTFPFAFAKDAVDGGLEPRLKLKEDGNALGPRLGTEFRSATSIEREIGEVGKGRYAFERGFLHFSASDNSDPRRNGRFYHVAYGIAVAPLARLLMVIAGLAAILSAAAKTKGRTPMDGSGPRVMPPGA